MGFFINMIFVFIIGRLIENALHFLRYRVGFFRPILEGFWRIGVIFHEFSHYIIAKILLVPVKFSDINFHTVGGGGVVKFDPSDEYFRKINFLKDLLIDVAPLWLGTCAITELYNAFVNNGGLSIKIISVLLVIAILCAFIPSRGDIKKLFFVIKLKPFVFVKQLIFLIISFLIYNLYFDFFYQFAPIYPYLFEFLILLVIEGTLEIIFIVLLFVFRKIFSYSNSKTIGFYNNGSGNVNEMFPSRRRRKKIQNASRSDLFTLLPDDDETAAEEFAQAMIENNAMMIDIENPDDEQ